MKLFSHPSCGNLVGSKCVFNKGPTPVSEIKTLLVVHSKYKNLLPTSRKLIDAIVTSRGTIDPVLT